MDGREALRIVFSGVGRTSPEALRAHALANVYFVDAQTYEPIELRAVADDGPW